MCFYAITRYSCSAETASLIEQCVMNGACLPHIQQIRETSAVCDLCAEACRWSEHDAIMQWLLMEREKLDSIAEGDETGVEEAVTEDGEDLEGSTDEDLFVEEARTDSRRGSAREVEDREEERVDLDGAEFRLSRSSSKAEMGGLRARRTTF